MPTPRRDALSSLCAICRQPAGPGARLCDPCRSALKRARDTTVSEQILPSRRHRRRPTPALAAGAPAESVPATPAVPASAARRWVRGAWLAVMAGLLVTSGAWIVHTRGIAGTIAPRYAIAPPESGAETIKAAATASRDPAASALPDRAAAPETAPRTLDARSLPAAIAVPRAATHAEPAVPLPPSKSTVAAPIVPEPAPPAPIVVAQAPAPRPAAPDRWQRLADALARCPADVIGRTMCEESLRLEHCEGFWGRVAACPVRPEREYGN
jgi:hypothetical protein